MDEPIFCKDLRRFIAQQNCLHIEIQAFSVWACHGFAFWPVQSGLELFVVYGETQFNELSQSICDVRNILKFMTSFLYVASWSLSGVDMSKLYKLGISFLYYRLDLQNQSRTIFMVAKRWNSKVAWNLEQRDLIWKGSDAQYTMWSKARENLHQNNSSIQEPSKL